MIPIIEEFPADPFGNDTRQRTSRLPTRSAAAKVHMHQGLRVPDLSEDEPRWPAEYIEEIITRAQRLG